MRNGKKIAIFLALFAGLTAYSFGDTLYTFTTGIYRNSEQYPDENYGKESLGVGLNIAIDHYFGNFPLGFFVNTALLTMGSGHEWKGEGEAMVTADTNSATDFRLSIGPSLGLKLGSIVQIPISVGPVFSYCYEEDYGYNSSGFYETINMGVVGDIAVAINPLRRFLLKSGFTVSYDFIRWERGRMDTELRKVFIGGSPKKVNYSAITLGIYMGIGMRFSSDNIRSKEKNNREKEEE